MPVNRSYCEKCDDYGHAAEDHKPFISQSEYRRLKATNGEDDWWVDHEASPNGIGPVCLFCSRLIDWGPRDHGRACPVRRFLREEE